MRKGHHIVKPVLEKFTGLSVKLAGLFGKKDVWYRSHGYPLKKDDAINNGNLSPVDHVLRMADEYEAACPGAGAYLGELLAAELKARFTVCDAQPSDREIRNNLNSEFFEAIRELDKADLAKQSILELAKTDTELSEIEKAIGDARATVRTVWREKETNAVSE